MSDERLNALRSFLKDTIRQQTDFRATDQARGVPPPPLQKPCPSDCKRIALPPPESLRALGKLDLFTAIANRESHREFAAAPLSLDELAFLLWATQGVREVLNPSAALRTVPSAGARHPFETYIAVRTVKGLKPGLYRYLPFDGELAQLSRTNNVVSQAGDACLGQNWMADAAAVFFWTATPQRTEWRYGAASHKVIALDAGHVCQNLYLACEAIGCGTCGVGAYSQEAVDKLLAVDGNEEFVVYIAPVGKKMRPA
ncbi:MAG: SagB/ThcOx family dehydrogenase [Victivallales bacterium]|nr:SagB/ThcOx family dehydrogenase [Victivallales bacterium]